MYNSPSMHFPPNLHGNEGACISLFFTISCFHWMVWLAIGDIKLEAVVTEFECFGTSRFGVVSVSVAILINSDSLSNWIDLGGRGSGQAGLTNIFGMFESMNYRIFKLVGRDVNTIYTAPIKRTLNPIQAHLLSHATPPPGRRDYFISIAVHKPALWAA